MKLFKVGCSVMMRSSIHRRDLQITHRLKESETKLKNTLLFLEEGGKNSFDQVHGPWDSVRNFLDRTVESHLESGMPPKDIGGTITGSTISLLYLLCWLFGHQLSRIKIRLYLLTGGSCWLQDETSIGYRLMSYNPLSQG